MKGNKMKYIIIAATFFLSACSSFDSELQAHLEAERAFAYQEYLVNNNSTEQLKLNGYDSEYVSDCHYHEELNCNFVD